jgi:hypothetical protein
MKQKINCNWHRYVDLRLDHQTIKLKINCNWHKYVDLGLPSGLLWATCNVGAKEPWESGLYFSWGNVDGHTKGSWYNFCETKYAITPGATLTGNIPVDAKYDAARANLGGSWRMPTNDEFKELCDNCTRVWTIQNGVYGRLFTSRINGNSVFFPPTGYYDEAIVSYENEYGYYWSSSPHSQSTVCYLTFGSGFIDPYNYCSMHYGFPVRAVLDHPKDSLLIKAIKR